VDASVASPHPVDHLNPVERAAMLLTVDDVAARLRVTKSWIYIKTKTNELPHIKVGRYIRFRATDIERYLSAQSQGGRSR